MQPYDHKDIEKKWQDWWQEQGTYATSSDASLKKAYILDMFPYPSGAGLHVGHPKGYIATDLISRMKRMGGYNVLHPMGWDAFGLPAEQFAIKNKIHPRIAVEQNVATYKRQLQMIGLDYDWSREINTTDPEYYRWTQWTFLKMFEKGLAYESYEPINWCPSCQTGLANEDLEDGKCERCGSEVEKKSLRQWVLRITEYADRMLTDLDLLPQWPEAIKESQRNWIGRSEGGEFDFSIKGHEEKITVFTTRADTLYGVTYVVLAPEHALVQKLKNNIENWDEVETFLADMKSKTEIERTAHGKEKTGIELAGIKAIHPATGEELPIWIADYVLASYGTGAVMAVPAHDERDAEFANKYNLNIQEVIAKDFTGLGVDTPRDGVETLQRLVVDAVIENEKGDFVLIKENNNGIEHIHFVGGGTDDEDDLIALKREIVEETGYIDFEIVRKINIGISNYSFRHTKNKNQKTFGYFYHVKLKSGERINSEVETGKHELVILPKDKVKDSISWPHHEIVWDYFLNPEKVLSDEGILINSLIFDSLSSSEARIKITKKYGRTKVQYKLRDWVFARQRYWGEPIPLIHCEKCGVVAVPEDQLPVLLPDVEHYEPAGTGESPLATIDEWVNVSCPKCGGSGKRETNTMPQWAGSCWYYLRYIDPKNNKELVNAEKEKYFMPVDVYVGGMEHATRHLIYARFWHKFLYDIGVVSTLEPFTELHAPGLILAEDGRKMSKRWGNVVNPDDVIERFGADAFRLYEMFMGPFENAIAWNTDGLVGTYRFLERVWRLGLSLIENSGNARENKNARNSEIKSLLHKMIKKVSDDITHFRFNTAVSQMMIFMNQAEKEGIEKESYMTFLKLLAPFAPHITEELWRQLGEKNSIHHSSWPVYDPALIEENTVTLGIQINGKVRSEISLAVGETETSVKEKVIALEVIQKYIEGKEIKKFIYVPGKIISIVI